MAMKYAQIIDDLRTAYDVGAAERDGHAISPWKVDVRQQFLTDLQAAGKQSLLEIGAGPGRDSLFFHAAGLTVVSTDLSPEMVARCRQKGLTAYVMDFLHLDFPPHSWDAVYALNCLLHVPKAELPAVLQVIHGLLRPDGLFYFGVYGGVDWEGISTQDHHQPARFFSFQSDAQLAAAVTPWFEILRFTIIPLAAADETFQSLLLRPRPFVPG